MLLARRHGRATGRRRPRDGARALELYDDATFKDILEGLLGAVDEDVAKGLLRQWASQQPRIKRIKTLAQFLKRKGGINETLPFSGELRKRGITNNPCPGLISKEGMDLDTATDIARQAGFFRGLTEHPTLGDLLDALERDLSEEPMTPARVRDRLKAVAMTCRQAAMAPHKLREAATALDRLPDVAKGWMASLRSADNGARLHDWCQNLGDILSAARRFREAAIALDRLRGMRLGNHWHRRNQEVRSAQRLAEELTVLAEKAADKVRKVKVEQAPDGDQRRLVKIAQGRRDDVQLRMAIRELGEIYEVLTGARPARREDPCKGQNGPFETFVKATIKPLWPYASGSGFIRDTVSKNRNQDR
jgi:hypothetical protein